MTRQCGLDVRCRAQLFGSDNSAVLLFVFGHSFVRATLMEGGGGEGRCMILIRRYLLNEVSSFLFHIMRF